MSVIKINKNPSRGDLYLFGGLLTLFAGIATLMVMSRTGHASTVRNTGMIAGGIVAVYWLIAPLRRWIYLAAVYVSWPIGFVVSHVILAVVYFGIFTPIGIIMKLCGYDPMQRKIDRNAKSYWSPRETGRDSASYFRQH